MKTREIKKMLAESIVFDVLSNNYSKISILHLLKDPEIHLELVNLLKKAERAANPLLEKAKIFDNITRARRRPTKFESCN